MLDLTAFKATGKRMSVADACEHLGIDPEYFWSGTGTDSVWVYDASLYSVERIDGTFWTQIERSEYTGTKESVEDILYFEWYITECVIKYTTEGMTKLLEEYAAYMGVEYASADEMLASGNEDTQLFLEWFLRRWNEIT